MKNFFEKEIEDLAGGKPFYFGNWIPKAKKKFQEFIFVAEMPSSRAGIKNINPRKNFDITDIDKKFQAILSELKPNYSFYITDIVKTMSRARRPSVEEIKKWQPILKKEIKIIKPEFIVALGNNAYEILKIYLPNFKIKKIWHPTNLRFPKRADIVRKQLDKLL